MAFELLPKGPFNLQNQNKYFGGFPYLDDENKSIVITFPVEGWKESAAVVITQSSSGKIKGEVFGGAHDKEKAWKQALAVMSLDVNATDWPDIGKRDKVIKNLQEKFEYLRPTLFHSPYEAAAAFIIGHRISIKQGRAIRQNIAKEYGEKITIDNNYFFAFPKPQVLLQMEKHPGLSQEKIERLHGVAKAALDGWLERKQLKELQYVEAIEKIKTIRGIGDFFAQGILFRGAGVTDMVTGDDITPQAIQQLYGLNHEPDREEVLKIADNLKPFRMWTTVLMHVWVRSEGNIMRKITPYKKKR